MARMRIDATTRSAVLICTSCGWRTIATTRARAWAQGLAHERQAHDSIDPTTANRASAHKRR